MGVTCQILLEKSKEGFYRSGQAVTGAVKYHFDKQMEFVSINISLIAKGKCKWEESSGKTTIDYCGKEDYVALHNIIQETENKGTTIYQQGYYEARFHFVIPLNTPSTFKTRTGKIWYKVIIKFEKPKRFKRFKIFETVIPVQAFVNRTNPEPILFGLNKTFLVLSSKHIVNVKAETDKTVIAPGESLNLKIFVNNESRVNVSGIKIELYEFTKYTSDVGHKKKKSTFFEETSQVITTLKNNTEGIINCEVPSLLSMYSIQYSKIILREYRLRVTLQLPFPFRNTFAELPIVIGDQPESYFGGQFSGYESIGYWEQMVENCDEKEYSEGKTSSNETNNEDNPGKSTEANI